MLPLVSFANHGMSLSLSTSLSFSSLSQGEMMAAKIPNARLEVLTDAGHMAVEKNAESFNAVLKAFLGNVSMGGGAGGRSRL